MFFANKVDEVQTSQPCFHAVLQLL